VCGVLVLTHNFEVWRPVIVWLLVFAIIGLWLQSGQWQNCKSKQVVRFDFLLFTGLKPVVNMCRSYGTYYLVSVFLLFNSQFSGGDVLTLNRFFLWLQQDVDATGNFVRCLQLSKLKLGLELKQKFAPKSLFLNNSIRTLLM